MSATPVTFLFQHFEGSEQEFLKCPKQNFLYVNLLTSTLNLKIILVHTEMKWSANVRSSLTPPVSHL